MINKAVSVSNKYKCFIRRQVSVSENDTMSVLYSVCVAVFVAAQVMSVSPFGFMRLNNTQGDMGNSPLAQILSDIKTQAQTAALPYVNQMLQPFRMITNNLLVMSLLTAQMINNLASQKLQYLSGMANVPGQQNATAAPTPTLAPQPGNTTNTTSSG